MELLVPGALALLVFGLAVGAVVAVFLGYPLFLWLRALRRPAPPVGADTEPSVTLLVVVRNGEALVRQKIENTLALDYPKGRLDLIVCSDGSTDLTVERIRAFAVVEPRLTFLSTREHLGKAAALNAGAARARGEILVCSDADALLWPDALRWLVRPFADPGVGGVCGARTLGVERASLSSPQSSYISLDSRVKELESRSGSITSNDGKLYAVRRRLFPTIAEGVTDDLWAALCVVDAGFRFVFEPRAGASIRVPARSASHEVKRRRRIVARSLRALWLMRRLFRPRRGGFYALGLFVNKVLRRLLPVFLLLALVSAATLAGTSATFRTVLLLAVGLLALAALGALSPRGVPQPLARGSTLALYFVLGNWGTLLGVVDFLSGRRIVGWDPVKGDGAVGEP